MPDQAHINSYINGYLRAYSHLNQSDVELLHGVLCPTKGKSFEEQFTSIQTSTLTKMADVEFQKIERPWQQMHDGLLVWMFQFIGSIRNSDGEICFRNNEATEQRATPDRTDIYSSDFQRQQAAFAVSLIDELHNPVGVHEISWQVIYKDSGKPAYMNDECRSAFLIETEAENQLLYLSSTLL